MYWGRKSSFSISFDSNFLSVIVRFMILNPIKFSAVLSTIYSFEYRFIYFCFKHVKFASLLLHYEATLKFTINSV